jgi:hypothetical protein
MTVRCRVCHSKGGLATYYKHREQWAAIERAVEPDKHCTHCGGSGPFYKGNRYRDGQTSWCRSCFRDAHRLKQKEYATTERRPATHTCPRCNGSGPFRSNRGRKSGYSSFCVACHKLVQAAYKASNPIVHALNEEKRRARKRGLPSTLTKSQWLATLEYFNHACAYCLRTGIPLTQEHMIAISRGGGHTEENVVPACMPCNARKRDRLIVTMVNMEAHGG